QGQADPAAEGGSVEIREIDLAALRSHGSPGVAVSAATPSSVRQFARRTRVRPSRARVGEAGRGLQRLLKLVGPPAIRRGLCQARTCFTDGRHAIRATSREMR